MSVTVKVLDARKEIANHRVEPGKVLVLEAQGNVNYQIVEHQTGLGPQNILTKRQGDDLVIFLEEDNTKEDIIIKNYYDEKGAMVIGLHENGSLYAYVPESGKAAESISVLAEEMIAPQALGGTELIVPFWAFNPWWLAGVAGVAGVAALAAAAGGGSKGGSSAAPVEAVAMKPTINLIKVNGKDTGGAEVVPPSDSRGLEIKFTDEAGNPQTISTTLGTDGKWVLNALPPSVDPKLISINPQNGVVSFDPQVLKDASLITSTSKAFGKKDSPQADGTTPADEKSDTPKVSFPKEPETAVGSAVVDFPATANEGVLKFTPEGSTDDKQVPVPVIRDPQTGKLKVDIDNLPPGITPEQAAQITFDGNKATLPAQLVKDGTPVSAQATETGKSPSEEATAGEGDAAKAPTDAQSAKPTVSFPTDPANNNQPTGGAEVAFLDEATSGKLTFTPEGEAAPVTVPVKKEHGTWVVDKAHPDMPQNINADLITFDGNKAKLDPQLIKDGEEVSATATEGSKKESDKATAGEGTAANAPTDAQSAKPTVSFPKEPETAVGSAVVDFPATANEGVLKFTPEGSTDDKQVPVPVIRDPQTGKLKVDIDNLPPGITPEQAAQITFDGNKATLPAQLVKDGTPVSAQATETGKSPSEEATAGEGDAAKAPTDAQSAKPTVSFPTDPANNNQPTGGAEVAFLDEATSGKLTFTPEGEAAPVTVPVKKEHGTWVVDKAHPDMPQNINADLITFDGNKAKLDPQLIKDGEEVSATATEGSKKESDKATAGEGTAANAPTDAQSAKPTVSFPKEPETAVGSAVVDFPATANEGVLKFTPEGSTDDKQVPVPVIRDPQTGKLKVDIDNLPPGITPEQAAQITFDGNKATLPAQLVKDGTPVSAQATETGKSPSEEATAGEGDAAKAPTDAQSAKPTVSFPTDPANNNQPTGGAEVAFLDEATSGKLTFTPEGEAAPVTVPVKKEHGTWVVDKAHPDMPQNINADLITFDGNKAKLDPQLIKDGEEVSATATEGSKKESDKATAGEGTAANAPTDAQSAKPTVSFPKEPETAVGSAVVDFPATANEGVLKFTPEGSTDDKQVPVPVIRDPQTGKLKVDIDNLPPGITPEQAAQITFDGNKATLPAQLVKDGTPVSAQATETGKSPSEEATAGEGDAAKAPTDAQSAKPTVSFPTDPANNNQPTGGAEVAFLDEATSGKLTFTPEGEAAPVTVPVKKEHGTWVVDKAHPDMPQNINADLITFDGNKAKLDPQLIKDGEEVSATATEGSKKESDKATAGEGTAANAPTDAQSAKPTVSFPKEPETAVGSAVVDFPATANEGVLKFTPEGSTDDKQVPVPVIRDPQTGKLKVDIDNLPPGITPEQAAQITFDGNKATLPAQLVKDGTPVSAQATETGKSPSEEATAGEGDAAKAPTDAQSAKPTVSFPTDPANNNQPTGGAEVAFLDEATSGKLTFTPEGEAAPVTVPVKKEHGTWVVDKAHPDMPQNINADLITFDGNKAKLDPQLIKDGEEVSATATEGSKKESDKATAGEGTAANAPTDAQSAKPTVSFPKEPETAVGSAVVDFPATANEGVLKFTPEGSTDDKQVPVPVIRDPQTGKLKVDIDNLPPGITPEQAAQITFDGNKATLPAQLVKDGTPVSAQATETGKSPSEEATAGEGDAAKAPTDAQSAKPTVSFPTDPANNNQPTGGAEVAFLDEATSGKLTFTPEGEAAPVTVPVKKEHGTWVVDKAHPDMPQNINADLITFDGNKAKLDPQLIKDGEEVSATATEGSKKESDKATAGEGTAANAPTDAQSAKPTVSFPKEPETAVGSAVVDFPATANEGVLKFTPEGSTDDKQVPVPVIRDPQTGKLKVDIDNLPPGITPEQAAQITFDGNKATLPAQLVKDGTPVSAQATETGKSPSEEATAGEGDAAKAPTDAQSAKPTVSFPTDPANNNQPTGGAEVAFLDEATSGKLTFTPEGEAAPVTVPVKKEHGTWVVDKAHPDMPQNINADLITFDGNKAKLDPQLIKDGEEVSATATEGSKKESDKATAGEGTAANAPTDAQVAAPKVEVGTDGGASTTPAPGNEEVKVEIPREDGTIETIIAKKQPNSTWKPFTENGDEIPNPAGLPSGVTFDENTGTVSVTPDGIKDGEKLKVTPKEGAKEGTPSESEPTKSDGVAATPTVTANPNDGGATVKPADGNEIVVVSFPSERPNETTTIIAKKDAQGNWKPVKAVAKPDGTVEYQEIPKSALPDGVDVANDGVITILENAVKDKGTISAIGREEGKTNSPAATATTKEDEQAAEPIINHGKGPDGTTPDGSLSITPAPSNDKISFSYDNENTPAATTNVEVEKTPTGYTLKVDGQDKTPSSEGAVDGVPGMSFNPQTGEVTLDKQSVADGQSIAVTATEKKENGTDERAPATNTDNTNPDRFVPPTIEKSAAGAATRGGVKITAGEDNVKLEVSFIGENGKSYLLTYQRDDLTSPWALKTLSINGSERPYTDVNSLEGLTTKKFGTAELVPLVAVSSNSNELELKPNAILDRSAVSVKGYSIDSQSGHAMDASVITSVDSLPAGTAVVLEHDSSYFKVGALLALWAAGASEDMPTGTGKVNNRDEIGSNRMILEVQNTDGGTRYFMRETQNDPNSAYSEVIKQGGEWKKIGTAFGNQNLVGRDVQLNNQDLVFNSNDLYIKKTYMKDDGASGLTVVMHTGYNSREVSLYEEVTVNAGDTKVIKGLGEGSQSLKISGTGTVDLGGNAQAYDPTNPLTTPFGNNKGGYRVEGQEQERGFEVFHNGTGSLGNVGIQNYSLYRYYNDETGDQTVVWIQNGMTII